MLSALPIVLVREVEYAGRGKIRVVRECGPGEIEEGGTWLTEVRTAVARLAHVLGLVLERETIREVESAAAKQKIARLEHALAELANRKDAAKPHRKRRRVKSRKVRPLGVQTRGVSGAEVRSRRVRAVGRYEDGFGFTPRPVVRMASTFRPAARVNATAVKPVGKSEDGL